jgi:hypothetical protein
MAAHLHENQVAKILKKLSAKMLEVNSIVINVLDDLHTPSSIPAGKGLYSIGEHFPIDEPEDLNDILVPDFFPSIRDHLVEKALRISQASLRFLSNREDPSLTDLDLFFFNDPFQAVHDLSQRDPLEIISLASREDSGRNFVGFGRGNKALKASRVSMCTSSMMKILYRLLAGV